MTLGHHTSTPVRMLLSWHAHPAGALADDRAYRSDRRKARRPAGVKLSLVPASMSPGRLGGRAYSTVGE